MAKFTVTRRNEQSSYIDPVSMTISLTNEELQTFTDALRPTGYSECIIQQLLDLINPPIAAKETEQEESNWQRIKEWNNPTEEKVL